MHDAICQFVLASYKSDFYYISTSNIGIDIGIDIGTGIEDPSSPYATTIVPVKILILKHIILNVIVAACLRSPLPRIYRHHLSSLRRTPYPAPELHTDISAFPPRHSSRAL